MSDKLHTEDLIRKRLEGAELSPSPESWSAIQRKLRWPQFLRFHPSRFNIYYAAALLIASTALVLLLAVDRDREELPVQEMESTSTSSIEASNEEGSEDIAGKTNSPDNSHSPIENEIAAGEESKSQVIENDREERRSQEQRSQELKSLESQEDKNVLAVIPLKSDPEQEQVVPPPVTYFTSSVQSGCVPLSVQFTDQSIHATSHHWDFGTGEESLEPNPEYLYSEPGKYMVTLTTTNHGSLETVSRMFVEVVSPPIADFQIEEGLKGIDNHVVLNLVNYSSDASMYEWCLVDESSTNCSAWSSGEQQPNLELKTITPDSRAVRLKAISEHGCIDTTTMSLPLVVQSSDTRIKFANAFSPNPTGSGDGNFAPGSKRNDLFYPIYIEVPVEFHMRVFTRRGEQIFETREIYQGWDGYMFQEPAPGDVYVWMAAGKWEDGETFSLRGDVTLVWNKNW